MNKFWLLILGSLLLVIAACSNDSASSDESDDSTETTEETSNNSEAEEASGTKMFTTDSGEEVEVPENPERIVVLHPTYIGALIEFGYTPEAVPFFVEQDAVLNDATEGIDRIDPANLEEIVNYDPDLIVATAQDENLSQLQDIAPTVTFDSNISTFRDNTLLLGELINEKEQAEQWLSDWDASMAEGREKYGELIEGNTLSIFSSDSRGFASFGPNYGRGGEILYEGYGFVQPDALAEVTEGQFSVELSPEDLPQYIGDYTVLAVNGSEPSEIVETAVWKNAEAVQNEHVITLDMAESRYNDPISLEYQRGVINEQLDQMK
ncbi:ABC transporter substrate-binding protein [Corticicoccus populi]|uniref:ABC transporter substrate-binding protein n=1 Tax=Corticicoccus populi TaxID=1812821 RepID=A0ABW5X0R2_9STAP